MAKKTDHGNKLKAEPLAAPAPVAAGLAVSYRSIGDLIPYARNTRKHDEAQIVQIINSINEFGFTNPVLLRDDDTIIAGHGRVIAAQRLGFETVPTIKLGHLSKTQARALSIADNAIAANSGWNAEMLSLEIQDLSDLSFDVSLMGLGDGVEEWLRGTPDPVLDDENEDGDLYKHADDEKQEASKPTDDELLMSGGIQRIILVYEDKDFNEFSEIIEFYKKNTGVKTASDAVIDLLRKYKNENN